MKMNHVGIMVGDMDKAVEFYTKALNLKIVMGNTKEKKNVKRLLVECVWPFLVKVLKVSTLHT
jgi:catechol 2,3-dioxygenase-like lactoylglutathione lyase family enzyme